jgi:hypothetical protein
MKAISERAHGYLPGKDVVDVFISYSHADNGSNWVTKFERTLKDRVHVRLGREPEIWRDRKLSDEQDFTAEIENRLKSTAILLLILSPSYHKSDFCGRERRHFLENLDGPLRLGTRLRMVKAIKMPSERDRTRVEEALGFNFFNEIKGSEHLPREAGFDRAVNRLADGIANILKEMLNAKTPVYVAEPAPPEARPAWTWICGDLRGKGFHVLPDERLDPSDPPSQIQSLIQQAESSVHLLGAKFEKFAEDQLKWAREADKLAWVWLPPGCTVDPEQKAHLDRLTGAQRLTVWSNQPHWDLPDMIARQIAASTKQAPEKAAVTKRLYLICDRKNPADEETATSLQKAIQDQEGFQVLLPETDRDPFVLDEIHQERLKTCEGVLIYWGHAGNDWFKVYRDDLLSAERGRRRLGSPRGDCLHSQKTENSAEEFITTPQTTRALVSPEPAADASRKGAFDGIGVSPTGNPGVHHEKGSAAWRLCGLQRFANRCLS